MKKFARSPNKKYILDTEIREEFFDEINQHYFHRERLGYRYFRKYTSRRYNIPNILFVKWGQKFEKKTSRLFFKEISVVQLPYITMCEYLRLTFYSSIRKEKSENLWFNFLEAWPEKFRPVIEQAGPSKKLKKLMAQYSGKVQNEHGDFTRNNLRILGDKIYLTDFDFFKRRQPLGFDLFDLLTSFKFPDFLKRVLVPNYYLNKTKYELITIVNDFLDASEGLRPGSICLDDPLAQYILRNGSGGSVVAEALVNDLVDVDRCRVWYVKPKEQNKFLWAVLEQNGSKFSLAGSRNALLEASNSCFLSEVGPKWLRGLIKLPFGQVSLTGMLDQAWLKEAIYEFEGDENYKLDLTVRTLQPFRVPGSKLKKSSREDYRRIKRKLEKAGGYRVDLSLCDNDILDVIILWHSERWPKGQFAVKGPYLRYIGNLVNAEKLHCFKLYLDGELHAINCGVMNNGEFVSLINVSSFEKTELSLGKFLIMEVVQVFDTVKFNFGDGAEKYKKLLSDDANITFDMQLKSQHVIHVLKKIKRNLV